MFLRTYRGLTKLASCQMLGRVAAAIYLTSFFFMQGCLTAPHDAQREERQSLQELVNGLVPLPPGSETQVPDESHGNAARFNADGEPYLMTGFWLRISVAIGDHMEVQPTVIQVSENLTIILPLVGTIDCADLTLNGLRAVLIERYSEFLKDPEIIVSFVIDENGTSPWGQVYVQGRVRIEGWVNIPATRDLRVSRAIQKAGGFAPSAKKNAIRVHRRDNSGESQSIIVDLTKVGEKGMIENDIQLKPGDIIYVDESVI